MACEARSRGEDDASRLVACAKSDLQAEILEFLEKLPDASADPRTAG